MGRADLLKAAGIASGGTATNLLHELELCDFIRAYNGLPYSTSSQVYQITDFFTIFYFRYVQSNHQLGAGYWLDMIGRSAFYAWAGLSFERLCLLHIEAVKHKLGISGVFSGLYSWQARASEGRKGAQIDLVIDRADNVINLCECKYTSGKYALTAEDSEKLRERMATFEQTTKTNKMHQLTMITSYGLKKGKYTGIVRSEATLDDLFYDI